MPLAEKRPLAADVEDCSATAFIIASFCAFVCGIDQGHFWGHLDVFVQNLNRCKWKSSSTTLYFDTSSSYDVAQFGFDTCDFPVSNLSHRTTPASLPLVVVYVFKKRYFVILIFQMFVDVNDVDPCWGPVREYWLLFRIMCAWGCAVHYNAAQDSAALYGTVPYSTVQTAQDSTVQHSTAHYSIALRSTAQRSTAQCSTERYGTVHHSTV